MTSTQRLCAADRGVLAAHLLSLCADDRRLRFGSIASDETIRRYVARIDFDRDAVFGHFAEDLLLAGVAHVAIVNGVAELGLSVLDGYRRCGIGSALLQRATGFARNRLVRTVSIHCLTENAAILHIARKSGMNIVAHGSEADAHLELPPRNAASLAAEFAEESLAQFDYNLKAHIAAAHRLQAAFTVRPMAVTAR